MKRHRKGAGRSSLEMPETKKAVAGAAEQEAEENRPEGRTVPSMGEVRRWIGLGFLVTWIWLGLYEGYPFFRSGRVDPVACSALLVGFAVMAGLIGFSAVWRRRLLAPRTLLVAAILAALASTGGLLTQEVIGPLMEIAVRWVVRPLCAVIGGATALFLVGYGISFSRMRADRALLAFCASFGASFFAFFAAVSLDFPLSVLVFSVFPLVMALCLAEGGPLAAWTHNDRLANGADESMPECEAPEEVKRSEHPGHASRYARGFVQMVIALAVFSFAASLTQSFEPPKDFALGVDEGFVGFFIMLAVVAWLLLKPKPVGTFKIIKVLYQGSIVLMVLKLVLQPLLTDDTSFAALNVITYMALFLVFWQLTVFVASVGEVEPARAFALVFGIAALCMVAGWLVGVGCYEIFGRERYYLSIATGCLVAVFCTFGFSVRNFPYLTLTGVGRERMRHREEGSADPIEVVNEVPLPALGDTIDSLAQEYGLTKREAEIFQLLAEGRTTEEIAEDLVISYYTVRTHIRNLYGKLGTSSRSEMLLLVSDRERNPRSSGTEN